jgi:hypothetical protein
MKTKYEFSKKIKDGKTEINYIKESNLTSTFLEYQKMVK